MKWISRFIYRTRRGLGAIPEPALCLLLALLAGALYANTLTAEFVSDDKGLIVSNRRVQSLGHIPRHFTEAFSQRGQGGSSTSYYRPVVTTSFAVDYAWSGGRPRGFHLTNTVVWAICVVLVYLLGRRLTPSQAAAVAGTLIFLAHPIHTETVAWISGRTDLFALVFMLGATLTALRFRDPGNSCAWLVAAGFLALMGMLSKEVALVLLPLWIIYEVTVGRESFREGAWQRSLAVGGVFSVATLAYLVARWHAVGGLTAASGTPNFNPWTLNGLATISRCVWEYLGKLALPLNLSFAFEFDPFSGPVGVLQWGSLVAGVLLLTLTVYASWRRPLVGFLLCWLWIGLLPALNFVPINEVVAERFLFVPSVGFCLLVGLAFQGSFVRPHSPGAVVGTVAMILLTVGWATQTVVRNGDWQSERTLYLSAVRTEPDRPLAQTLAAEVYLSDPHVPERAILHYRRALELADGKPALQFVIHNGLGQTHRTMGQMDRALAHYERALELKPDSPVVRTNMALLWIQLGEGEAGAEALEKGRRELERVARETPGYADAQDQKSVV